MIHLKRRDFVLLIVSFSHAMTWNRGAPQSARLEMKDSAVKFAKGPPFGISPCSLLKETFRYLRYFRASSDLGIEPDKLFPDRFNYSKLTKSPRLGGIWPCSLLWDRKSWSRFWRSDMVLGMFPENWFFDRSNTSKDFMFPTSRGSWLLRKFEDKLRIKWSLRVHRDEGISGASPLE